MRTFTVNGNRAELFVPLSKFNERTGEFEAWSTIDELDAHKEICDVERSWPALVRWSTEQSELSDGKSVGNLRVQHRRDSNGGKITLMELGEREGLKGVYVAGRITNDQAKRDAAEGVLTGISIRGMADRWVDPENENVARYVWTEVEEKSIVDRPAVPHALIEVLKSNGSVEMIKAEGRQVNQLWDCGLENCTGKHVRKEEAVKCEGQLPTRIEATKSEDTKKSLWRIGDLVAALSTLLWCANDSEFEEAWRAIEGKTADPNIVTSLKEGAKKIFDAIEAILADERVLAELDAAEPAPLAEGEVAASFAMRALTKSPIVKQLIKSLRVPPATGAVPPIKEVIMEDKKKEEAPAETPAPEPAKAEGDANSLDAVLAKLDEISARCEKLEQICSAHGEAISALQAATGSAEPSEAQKAAGTKLDALVATVEEQAKSIATLGGDVKLVSEALGSIPTMPKGALIPRKKEDDTPAPDTSKAEGNPWVTNVQRIA